MTQADSLGQPSPPDIFAIYRAFYVLPSDTLNSSIVRVDFFVSRSPNGMGYEGNQVFSYGDNNTGFFAVHTGLDENTSYAYRCQYVCRDGSKTSMGQMTEAGPAQLSASSDLNIDQLASKSYSTGLITSGIFQGVIFRTAPIDPKVQMDPTGIWAENSMGRKTFYLHADGSEAYFSGQIDLQESSNILDPSTPSEISWGGEVVKNTVDIQYIPGSWSLINTPFGYSWSRSGQPGENDNKPNIEPWICALNPSSISYWLEGSNYGFNIPSNATITGIQLWIHKGQGVFGTVSDLGVYLLRGGTFDITNKAEATQWTVGDQWIPYGNSTDLWGTSWTPADINSSGFGAAIVAQNTSGSQGADAAIYNMQLFVYYNVLELGTDNAWIQGVFQNNQHGLFAGAGGSSVSRLLINDAGQSDYLQVTQGSGHYNVNWGSTQITASANTNFNIAHGLGKTPISWVAMLDGVPGFVYGEGQNSTNIVVASSVALSNNFVTWIVIG